MYAPNVTDLINLSYCIFFLGRPLCVVGSAAYFYGDVTGMSTKATRRNIVCSRRYFIILFYCIWLAPVSGGERGFFYSAVSCWSFNLYCDEHQDHAQFYFIILFYCIPLLGGPLCLVGGAAYFIVHSFAGHLTVLRGLGNIH